MTKTIGIVVAIAVVIGGAYLINRAQKTSDTSSNTPEQNNQNTNAQGRVIFSVTDTAVDMSTISEINMKVSKVDMHSNTSGWVTVSTVPYTYSLLDLNAKNESKLLADIKAKDGTYDQVRLTVDSVSVKTKAGVTKEAKLPSGELKINMKLVVNADKTSSVNLDFLTDKSLHTTGNGNYIFAPVVKTETKSDANVSVNASNTVTIAGGKIDDANIVGMDIDGSVKLNFQIDSKQKLNLDSNNVIKVEGILK